MVGLGSVAFALVNSLLLKPISFQDNSIIRFEVVELGLEQASLCLGSMLLEATASRGNAKVESLTLASYAKSATAAF
jgi:hypothetical protein